MRVNFFAPMRMTLALLPTHARARLPASIVNVSSVGGRLGIIHEAAYWASKFALCGWSEAIAVDLYGTGVSVRLVKPGPSTPRSGTSRTTTIRIYDGPKVPAEEVAAGIVAAIDSDAFEHYVPDMKAVVDAKNADIDAFIAGAAAMASAMRALVFGVRARAVRGARGRQPTRQNLARTPVGIAWTCPTRIRCTMTGWSPGRG